jgi:hypothetical protein
LATLNVLHGRSIEDGVVELDDIQRDGTTAL